MDDEDYIRVGMVKKITRLIDYARVIGEACDGEEALVLTEKLRPDIVVVDIKMPKIDGLQYIEHVLKQLPRTHFIIISGFDNFSYAQKALRLGVHDYLLKPVNNADLCAAMQSVCRMINSEREQDAAITKFDQKQPMASFQKKNSVFNPLALEKGADSEVCRSVAKRLGFLFPHMKYTAVAMRIADGFHRVFLPQSVSLAQFAICNIIEETLCDDTVIQCFYEEGDMPLIYGLINHNLADVALEELLKQALVNVKNVLEIKLVLGMSRSCCEFSSLMELCAQAVESLSQGITLTDKSVLRPQDVQLLAKQHSLDADKLRVLSRIISGEPNNLELITSKIDGILFDMKQSELSFGAIRTACIELLQTISHELRSKSEGFYTKALDGNVIRHFTNCWTFVDFQEATSRYISELSKLFSEANVSGGKKVVSKIIARIEEEYYKDLKMSALASDYYINQSYLSVLFQQETGINYSQYLANVRMKKAREFLESTNLSTGKIAELVGYNDRNYFATVFAKNFGMTPVQYRNSLISK